MSPVLTRSPQPKFNRHHWWIVTALQGTGLAPYLGKSSTCSISHLPKGCPSVLKATHLQSLFDHIQGVRETFADNSSTAATEKVFNAGWEAERKKDSREEKKRIISEFWLKMVRGKLKITFHKK